MERNSDPPSRATETPDGAARPARGAGLARARALVLHSRDAITILRPDGAFEWLSPSAAELLGAPPSMFVGRRFEAIVHRDQTAQAGAFLRSIDGGSAIERRADWLVVRRDGTERWVEALAVDQRENADIGGVVVTLRDITQRKTLEQQLERRAFHDSLTGLANRARFLDRLEHALERQKRARKSLGLLYLDVDRFKRINDSRGHPTGDAVLIAIADRLTRTIRSCDTAGRLSGDEFAVLLEDLRAPADAGIVAERISEAVRAPMDVGGEMLVVSASIGVAVSPGPGATPERLMRDADTAMYAAKNAGRGCWRVYDPAETAEMPLPDELKKLVAGGAGPTGSRSRER